ncbi:hypothetical protein LEP1GSC047_1179 [Leptospira inadai serovar Lyme str. 10]|uniref:Uncharacterized protein n=2 Tax=Leptospira inadai serovar Lyme TaxID=293084 RepID=V6HS38_9LEPT|nr:hypothetical protein [Leptospira inadai]EQA35384.1 hypothetical protein LEP1GSC047_1179 [Leptospira inadai serovar Lyme str. 10]PNV75924.1 hypothetical protein BES34_005290 [Leptospira inadai serovar Lyme]
MIGTKLRFLLAFALLFSFLILWLEPYFPDGVFYRSKLETAFAFFNKNIINLEDQIRSTDPSLLDTKNVPLPVRSFAIWDASDQTITSPELDTNASKQLLVQAWEGNTSRLLPLGNEPVFFVPLYEKQIAVLALLDKEKFFFDFDGKKEYFVPELKVGSFRDWIFESEKTDPRRIVEEILYSLKETGADFKSIDIGDREYRAYYAHFPEDKSGFIQGFFLLIPAVHSEFIILFPLFFGLLFLLDISILFLRKQSIKFSPKRADVSQLSQLLAERIKDETLKKIEAIKKLSESNETGSPVFETKPLASGTFYVLPFDLPEDSFLTPKFLRDPKPLSVTHMRSSIGIRDVTTVAESDLNLSESIQRKRDSIFTDELAKLVDKVRSTGVPASIEIEEKAKETGLLAKALRVTGLAEVGLKAARGIAPQHKSRFFLWARAWWGIRKTDPNEEMPLSDRFRTWLDRQPIREKRKILEVLDEIHQGLDTSVSSLLKYYLTIFSSLHVKSFSIHFYDRRRGAYQPAVTYGMQPYTRQNMIFLYGDQFLGQENNEVSIIDVTEERRNDHFFIKKFDPADLDGVIRIISFPLFRSGLDFRFFLLFPDPPNAELTEQIRDSVEKSIDPVEDAFLQLEIEQASHAIQDKRDLVQIQFLLLRWATHGERSRCNLFKIRLKGHQDYDLTEDWRRKILAEVQPLLGTEDYAFGISASEIFVLSRENMNDDLRNILQTIGLPFEIIHLPYPENGKNLYTYI